MKDYTIYVTEEIAKKAMEKGFKFTYANEYEIQYKEECLIDSIFLIPTAEQICGWLREEYGIVIDVNYYFNMSDTPHFEENVFEWSISYPKKENDRCSGSGFKYSYTEALLEGINKALDLI